MNRHIFGHLLLSLILILTACNSSTSVPISDRVTIAFMTFPMEPPGLWEDLIATFEEANPTINVEPYYQQIPNDWPKQADVALSSGLVWGQDVVDRGWVLDLAPFIESDPGFDADDFHPGVLALHRRSGHTWAVPVSVEFSVLVYRPDLFREAGEPLGGPEATCADVMKAARRLSSGQSTAGRRYSFLDEANAQALALDWIAEQSGGLYREEEGNVVPTLDRPEVQQALSEYLSAAEEMTAMVDGPREMTTAEVLERIVQGEVGMAVVPLSTVTPYLDQYPEIAIAPLPPGEVVAQYAVYPSAALAISAGTAHPQAAWRWVRFLSRQNLDRGDIPARRSVAELSGTWDRMSPQMAGVIHSSLENQAGRLPLGFDTAAGAVYSALSKALANIQDGQTDVRTALDGAQREALSEIQAWQERRDSVTPVPFSVSAPPSPTETTIEFQVGSSPHEQQLYGAAAEAFETQHPGWHVRVSALGTARPEGCLATYVDRSALTAALTWNLLAELDPLAEANRFSSGDFFPQAIAAVTWQGRLYGVPGSIKPLVLYYNPDVFRRADLELPSSDWTVEDVLTAAEQIEAHGSAGDVGYLPHGRDVPFLLQQQGILLFTDDQPPRPRFTAPEVLQELQRLRRLGDGQVAFPTPYSDMLSLIKGGRVGMWFNVFDYWSGTNWPTGTGVTAIQLRQDTPLPVQVNTFGLASGVQHPQACWEWINFLTHQGMRPEHELPALRHLAEDEATRQVLGDELYTAYVEALRRDDGPVPGRDTVVEDWAAWWFTQAVREAEPEEWDAALQTAQDKAETFVACLGPAGGQDIDQAQMCAQQADPDHPLAHLTP